MSCCYFILVVIVSFHLAVGSFCDRPETNADRLVQLIVVIRSGARTPLNTFPKDLYQENFWDQYGGLGQLTQDGSTQQFLLGQFVKNCYFPELDSNTLVRTAAFATSDDRALMSGSAFMGGLVMPPTASDIASFLHVLRPIHTLPTDFVPADSVNVEEDDKKRLFDGENAKHRETLEYLAQMAGLNSSYYKDVAMALTDPVLAEEATNVTLVDWLANNETLRQFIHEMADFQLNVVFQNSLPERSRLFASPLVDFVVSRFGLANAARTASPNEKNKEPKLIIVCGDETFVAGILTGLGGYNDRRPPFSSAVLLELSTESQDSDDNNNDTTRPQPIDGVLKVSVFYRNDSAVDPYPISVRNDCGESCDLVKFGSSLQDVITPTVTVQKVWSTVEDLRKLWPENFVSALIAMVTVVVFLVLTIIILAIIVIRRKRRRPISQFQPWEIQQSPRRAGYRHGATRSRQSGGSPNDYFFDADADDDDDDFSAGDSLLMTQTPPASSSTNTAGGDMTRMPLMGNRNLSRK